MRKRASILVGGGVAIFIASQFFDFGLGFRDGGSSVTTQAPKRSIKLEADQQASEPVTAPENSASESAISIEEPAVQPGVVDVIIHVDQYLVMTDAAKPDQRHAMTLDEVIAMIEEVPGEPSGIKIRIARTPDAMAVAHAAIMNRLHSAGVNPDSIDSRRQLVPLEDAN